MKNYTMALAVIGALTLGGPGPAEARDKGQGHGVQMQTQAAMQHRAGSRNEQHATHRPRVKQYARALHKRVHARASKRIWRMKARHYRAKPGYWHHRRLQHSFRGPHHRGHQVDRAYPVYEDSTGHSLGVDIETEGFRFSVNKSE